jgi:hypothetical protein
MNVSMYGDYSYSVLMVLLLFGSSINAKKSIGTWISRAAY